MLCWAGSDVTVSLAGIALGGCVMSGLGAGQGPREPGCFLLTRSSICAFAGLSRGTFPGQIMGACCVLHAAGVYLLVTPVHVGLCSAQPVLLCRPAMPAAGSNKGCRFCWLGVCMYNDWCRVVCVVVWVNVGIVCVDGLVGFGPGSQAWSASGCACCQSVGPGREPLMHHNPMLCV